MSSAILRTCARRSAGLSLSAGSSRSLMTWSTWFLSCSVGAPAQATVAATTIVDRLAKGVRERLRGNHERVVLEGEGQRDVDELAGPQPPLGVGERGLEPDRAGGLIDGVVDERHRAALGLGLARGDGVHGERAGRHVALD